MAYEREYRGERYRDDRGDRNDRGFFERAGDEVRSWFGDEEAERRRRYDERQDDRVDRERYAGTERGGYRSPGSPPGWYRSDRDDYRRGGGAGNYGYQDYRDYEGRQFDEGGRGYGSSVGDFAGERDRDRSVGRDRADRHGGEWQRGYDRDAGRGWAQPRDEYGYANWRDRQMSAFDRDYDEYRRENQSRFETEFATWRQNRQTQRDSLGQVKEHQEVVGSDGVHVGTVDHVRSDHILLTKTDKDAGGHHHSIPSSWIAGVADTVKLSRTADEAKRAWRDTEERGGLFGDKPEDRGDGAHGQLGRSFGGTY